MVNGFLCVLMAGLLLSGCQSFINLQAWPPPYSLPAGSGVSINRDLSVAPYAVSVWIQYGKVLRRRDVNLSYANCRFELYTLQAVERTIYKGEARIEKFVNSTDYVSSGFFTFASLVNVSGDDGASTAGIYSTNIYLQSAKQPDLYRLICEHWDDPASGSYLTIAQIQEALGNIATLHQSN
ncbi:MAG: hypothetical protein PVJ72_10425 [Gammaproteobacteria bacterium]|jgi:hypothetical protein